MFKQPLIHAFKNTAQVSATLLAIVIISFIQLNVFPSSVYTLSEIARSTQRAFSMVLLFVIFISMYRNLKFSFIFNKYFGMSTSRNIKQLGLTIIIQSFVFSCLFNVVTLVSLSSQYLKETPQTTFGLKWHLFEGFFLKLLLVTAVIVFLHLICSWLIIAHVRFGIITFILRTVISIPLIMLIYSSSSHFNSFNKDVVISIFLLILSTIFLCIYTYYDLRNCQIRN